MRSKSILLFSLALGCGLIAAVGINQVLAKRRTDTAQTPQESVSIFVAMKEISMGDPLSLQTVKLEQWPKDKIPLGSITELEHLEGRRTRARFFPGEPILEAKLFAKGENAEGASPLIPAGHRVVPIKVDSTTGISGLVLPGDRVDVIVHVPENRSKGIMKSFTITFLKNIKVFAADDIFEREKEGDKAMTAKTISLLVTPQQAEMLTMADETGEIRLAMRNAKDESESETEGVTMEQLLGLSRGGGFDGGSVVGNAAGGLLSLLNGSPAVQPTPLPTPSSSNPAPALPQAKPMFAMTVLAGANASQYTFEADQQRNQWTTAPSTGKSNGQYQPAPVVDETPEAEGTPRPGSGNSDEDETGNSGPGHSASPSADTDGEEEKESGPGNPNPKTPNK